MIEVIKKKHVRTTCEKCEMIKDVLRVYGETYRGKITESLAMPRTTVYDHINWLKRRGIIKEGRWKGNEVGRPLTTFKMIREEGEDYEEFKLTPQQKDVMDIHKHDLYINVWGRGTGKTSIATMMALSGTEPAVMIVPNKKERVAVMSYFIPRMLKNVEYKQGKVMRVAHQNNYMSIILMIQSRIADRLNIIIDGYGEKFDTIVDNLLKMENIKIIAFITPEVMRENKIRKDGVKRIEYIHKLYYGFYKLRRSISMKTSIYPTSLHIQQLIETYGNRYKMPKRCFTENTLSFLRKKLPNLKIISEYECRVLDTMKILSK